MPESGGFLAGDLYTGIHTERSSQTLAVLYWRSYDDLLRYAHSGDQLHRPGQWLVHSRTGSPMHGLVPTLISSSLLYVMAARMAPNAGCNHCCVSLWVPSEFAFCMW